MILPETGLLIVIPAQTRTSIVSLVLSSSRFLVKSHLG